MARNKLFLYIGSSVLFVLVVLFCLAITARIGCISAPCKTDTQRIQVTNDTAHNQFVFKNLNTGETLYFSSRDANLPVPTAEWINLTYYPCDIGNSKYNFSGRVFLSSSTKPVDLSGAYLFALTQSSSAMGKYDKSGGWISGIHGIHSAQWDVSANATNGKTQLTQAAPDRTININPGGYPVSFGDDLDSLQPSTPFTPCRTTLTGVENGYSYHETWTNNSLRDGYAIWYPNGVPIQGVTTWYVPANTTVTWTWTWSVQYK